MPKAKIQPTQPQNVSLSVDLNTTPILYTDNILISTNEDGVVLDVTQKLVGSNQVRIVSRIGMSRTQAKKFITEAGRLVALTEKGSPRGEAGGKE